MVYDEIDVRSAYGAGFWIGTATGSTLVLIGLFIYRYYFST